MSTNDDAGIGSMLSWPLGGGPGLDERPVDVVLDIDVARFNRLTVKLLTAPAPGAR